jgi:peptidoglycan/xylan/chitin deacetylase (PgdA/CDA1 family)
VSEWHWPDAATVAVSFTFDVDAEAGWLGAGEQYARRLTTMSEGRFGVVRGLRRVAGLLQRYQVPATFFVPGYTADRYPSEIAALLEAGHELAHHGHMHLRSDKADAKSQRVEIEMGLKSLDALGVRPSGYRSPSWELTPETFDLLLEFDFDYDSSCMGDDRPYWEHYEGRHILELPVHWSLDDWPRFGWSIDGGGNVGAPADLYDSWLAEYRLARHERRHITFTMHPEVIGRGQRFVELERLIATIAEDEDVWFARLDGVATHVRPALDAGP